MNFFDNWSVQSWLDADNLFVIATTKARTFKTAAKGAFLGLIVAASINNVVVAAESVSSNNDAYLTVATETVGASTVTSSVATEQEHVQAFDRIDAHIARLAGGDVSFPSKELEDLARRAAEAADISQAQSPDEWAETVLKNLRLAV